MSNEAWKTLAIILPPICVFLSRIWSMFEHRKTGKAVAKTEKDVARIMIILNGETEKKIQEAILEGMERQKKIQENKT